MKHGQARLAHEIRDRIAQILRTQVGDPRLSGVSISEVRVAPDASYARVFWSTLGAPAAAAEAIEKAKPYLRRCLASELRTRRVPELDFRVDDAADRARRVEDVMRELERERQDASVRVAGPASARVAGPASARVAGPASARVAGPAKQGEDPA